MKNQARILVIDDDRSVVAAIGLLLEHAGYRLAIAYDGQQALRKAYEDHPDLILLDVNLPDRDGFSVLGRLREQTDVPVLMLTARTLVDDRVRGLDEGADDYILKPFDTQELLARVRKHLRSVQRQLPNKSHYIVDQRLSIDFNSHQLDVDGARVRLTPIEWRVLRRLVEGGGRIVSTAELLAAGWGTTEHGDARSVKVRISSLRHKIGDDASASRYIHTEREIGYRFEALKEKTG